jgi:cytochrome c oxidase subunit 2
MWFTPKFTTKEMKVKTNNPDFVYEISCDQMCGKGHYSMRGIIEVVTQVEFDAWLASQKPKYQTAVLDKLPKAAPPSTAVDSSVIQTTTVPAGSSTTAKN